MTIKETKMKEKLNFINFNHEQHKKLRTKVILFVSLSKNFSFIMFPIIILGIVDRKNKKRKRHLYKRRYSYTHTHDGGLG